MKETDPLTFVVGVVPFSQAKPVTARNACGHTCSPNITTTTNEAAHSALLPLVQLLARTAAREAFGVFLADLKKQKD